MQMGVTNQAALMENVFVAGELSTRDFEEENEVGQSLGDVVVGEGSVGEGGEGGVGSRGNGGAIRDRPVEVIPCPRCQSMNTKFCYYNNYSTNQPRHFCRNCQRYWTVGGTLRNVPVGGGSRKKTRTRSRNDAYLVQRNCGNGFESPPASNSGDVVTSGLLSANSCVQQLSMLPPTLSGKGFAQFPPSASQLPFLGGFGASTVLPQMVPTSASLISGLQEVPEMQRMFYELPQVPQVPQLQPRVNSALMMPNPGYLRFSEYHAAASKLQAAAAQLDTSLSKRAELASELAKAGLWSTPAGRNLASKVNSQIPRQSLNDLNWRYDPEPRLTPIDMSSMNSKLAPLPADLWVNALLHSKPLMDDRLVPHVTSISPNSSTIEEEICPPSNCFGYSTEDVVSQPWVGLQASDILQF